MSYYKVCPYCGATLDPGEKCECRSEEAKRQRRIAEQQEEFLSKVKKEKDGQLRLII